MRLCFLCFLLSAGVASAQNLGLVGNRFHPLKAEELTPEQKVMVDHLLSGQRRGLGGPFNVLLRSPEMGDAAQHFGEAGRFHPGLSAQVAEMVIIMTARNWSAQFEWTAHKNAALRAGLDPAVAEAIATGKRPMGLAPDLEAAYEFIDQLFTTHQVSDAAFERAKTRFGEKGIVDILATAGWYTIVSMALNVDQYPLANGAKPELVRLENPLPRTGSLDFATEPKAGHVVAKSSTVGNKKFELRGDRFPGLAYDDMTADQKAATGQALLGRGTVGIFNIAVRDPLMVDALWAFGDRIRFHLSVPDKLKELAILITARYWTAQYEWLAHRNAGIQAGLKEQTLRAIAEGRRPSGLDPSEQAVYDFVVEYLRTGQTSDPVFQTVKDRIGERGIVEIIGASGYYQLVSMFMNVDRYPLNPGQTPELIPLKNPLP